MGGLENVSMKRYDPVKEMATFVYVGKSGEPSRLNITRFTFEHLMTPGAWDRVKMGEPYGYQTDFASVVKKEIENDFMGWFDKCANRCLEENQ